MEWKKVQFKADQKDRKNVVMKRMTGMIEEVLQEVNPHDQSPFYADF